MDTNLNYRNVPSLSEIDWSVTGTWTAALAFCAVSWYFIVTAVVSAWNYVIN